MAARGAKRSAATHGSNLPESKRLNVSSRDGMIELVVNGIEKAAGLRESSRTMLQNMAPYCLSTPFEERHEYALAVTTMLQQAFQNAESTVAAAIEDAAAEEAQGVVELERLTRHTESLRTRLASEMQALESAKDSWSEVHQALRESWRALHKAREERRHLDANIFEAIEKREALEAAVSAHLEFITQGICKDTHELGASVDSLVEVCTRASMDSGLVGSFALAGRKTPEERTSFHKIVIDQLGQTAAARAKELVALIERGNPGSQEREAAEKAAEEAFATAESRMIEAARHLRKIEVSVQLAESDVIDAEEAEQQGDEQKRRKAVDHVLARWRLEQFQLGPLAAFQKLKGGSERDRVAEEERSAAEVAARAEEERLAAEAVAITEDSSTAVEAAARAGEERFAADAVARTEDSSTAVIKFDDERLATDEEGRLADETVEKVEAEHAASGSKAEQRLAEEEEGEAAACQREERKDVAEVVAAMPEVAASFSELKVPEVDRRQQEHELDQPRFTTHETTATTAQSEDVLPAEARVEAEEERLITEAVDRSEQETASIEEDRLVAKAATKIQEVTAADTKVEEEAVQIEEERQVPEVVARADEERLEAGSVANEEQFKDVVTEVDEGLLAADAVEKLDEERQGEEIATTVEEKVSAAATIENQRPAEEEERSASETAARAKEEHLAVEAVATTEEFPAAVSKVDGQRSAADADANPDEECLEEKTVSKMEDEEEVTPTPTVKQCLSEQEEDAAGQQETNEEVAELEVAGLEVEVDFSDQQGQEDDRRQQEAEMDQVCCTASETTATAANLEEVFPAEATMMAEEERLAAEAIARSEQETATVEEDRLATEDGAKPQEVRGDDATLEEQSGKIEEETLASEAITRIDEEHVAEEPIAKTEESVAPVSAVDEKHLATGAFGKIDEECLKEGAVAREEEKVAVICAEVEAERLAAEAQAVTIEKERLASEALARAEEEYAKTEETTAPAVDVDELLAAGVFRKLDEETPEEGVVSKDKEADTVISIVEAERLAEEVEKSVAAAPEVDEERSAAEAVGKLEECQEETFDKVQENEEEAAPIPNVEQRLVEEDDDEDMAGQQEKRVELADLHVTKLEVEACCSEQQRWEADGRQHEDQIEQVLFMAKEKIATTDSSEEASPAQVAVKADEECLATDAIATGEQETVTAEEDRLGAEAAANAQEVTVVDANAEREAVEIDENRLASEAAARVEEERFAAEADAKVEESVAAFAKVDEQHLAVGAAEKLDEGRQEEETVATVEDRHQAITMAEGLRWAKDAENALQELEEEVSTKMEKRKYDEQICPVEEETLVKRQRCEASDGEGASDVKVSNSDSEEDARLEQIGSGLNEKENEMDQAPSMAKEMIAAADSHEEILPTEGEEHLETDAAARSEQEIVTAEELNVAADSVAKPQEVTAAAANAEEEPLASEATARTVEEFLALEAVVKPEESVGAATDADEEHLAAEAAVRIDEECQEEETFARVEEECAVTTKIEEQRRAEESDDASLGMEEEVAVEEEVDTHMEKRKYEEQSCPVAEETPVKKQRREESGGKCDSEEEAFNSNVEEDAGLPEQIVSGVHEEESREVIKTSSQAEIVQLAEERCAQSEEVEEAEETDDIDMKEIETKEQAFEAEEEHLSREAECELEMKSFEVEVASRAEGGHTTAGMEVKTACLATVAEESCLATEAASAMAAFAADLEMVPSPARNGASESSACFLT